MVKSKKGMRHVQNWRTRVSAAPEKSAIHPGALDKLVNALGKKNKELDDLNIRARELNREKGQLYGQIRKTDEYRALHRNEQSEYLKKHPEYARLTAATDKAIEAVTAIARTYPEYVELEERVTSKKLFPNYDNQLTILSIKTGRETPIYAAEKYIGEVDLHFDGNKVLFTSFGEVERDRTLPSSGKGFRVFELEFDPKTGKAKGRPRLAVPDIAPDVDSYDACYLADDKIIFASTASYQGVPCVGGRDYVANLYRVNKDGSDIRRITFDQEGNWSPTMMANGRVLFLRWEYTDSAHYFTRILMTMNPDGSDQKAFYGSNSYWPNSMFDARQIPGKSTQFIATICGHHDASKQGALCLFDVSKGRNEADGAVQLLTQRGKKVEPIVQDGLANRHYRVKFMHPYPLNDKYFLANKGQDIYLMDIYDNMVKLGEGYEPIPLRKTKRPHSLPDRTNISKKDATVLINDVYEGPGLKGVPRGTVKALRLYRYEYAVRNTGGHYALAMEGGWDTRQVMGTVPVEDDGSASFKVPANAPFSMQPLDKEGKALQIMRSWTVAMPGENLSCIGCHESQDMAPPTRRYKAMMRAPSQIKPFYGPMRGFSFEREVYDPVIQKYCIGCHDGSHDIDARGRDKAGRYVVSDRIIGTGSTPDKTFREQGIPDFTTSNKAYDAIHPFVRRTGPEGDYHLLTPLEFHAGTSELFQMLEKGHHDVKPDAEAMYRLVTWADINVPKTGTWSEQSGRNVSKIQRRYELAKKYGGVDYDPEELAPADTEEVEVVMPKRARRHGLKAESAKVKGAAAEGGELDLGDGIKIQLATLPAGSFSMGSNDETPVEQPVSRVTIDKPFKMGITEVTLRQYRQFDPEYLNGVYDMHYKDQVHRGYYMNDMDFPVIRVSWEKAQEFCKWLSGKTGRKVSLPTESQWEWACRAGTKTPFSFGEHNSVFSEKANLSDRTVKEMAVSGVNPRPIRNPSPNVDFKPKDIRSDDGVLHLAEAGSYDANPWGLYDMHGNVAEWTQSDYKPYPYKDSDGRNSDQTGKKVAVVVIRIIANSKGAFRFLISLIRFNHACCRTSVQYSLTIRILIKGVLNHESPLSITNTG
jgi:formylglycine-generating enzyme required for sulfatase activity